MIYYLSELYLEYFPQLNLFQYITVRIIFAAITGLIFTLLFGPIVIKKLADYGIGEKISKYNPNTHLTKTGTPTMGGIMIILSVILSSVIWADLSNKYIIFGILIMLSFGALGFFDDYTKLKKNSKGIKAKTKFLNQVLLSLIFAILIFVNIEDINEQLLFFPFFKEIVINLSYFYIPLFILVIVSSCNSVNLTDGLDGLAITPVILVCVGLGIFTYLSGHINFANYLLIPHLPGVGELTIFIGAIVGSGLGFLWYNSYPAQIFMGDVGSLSLGAALGIIAVSIRQEFILMLMGGVFVIETLSVILQIASFRLTGKRIFKMAPLHHHFELSGLAEPKIIVRFWIITLILVLFALATFRLR